MTALVIILAVIITIMLNIVFAKKIKNRANRNFMYATNIIISVIFLILFCITGFIKNNLNSFIDFGINKLETKVNEIYPGAIEIQMNTTELKELLEKSFDDKTETKGLEGIATNILKNKIQKYTSGTLKILNTLEREENKLSVKDALISIKEPSLQAITTGIRFIKIGLFILYFLFIIFAILFSKSLQKEKQNQGIVFGEDADKTFIGMENK